MESCAIGAGVGRGGSAATVLAPGLAGLAKAGGPGRSARRSGRRSGTCGLAVALPGRTAAQLGGGKALLAQAARNRPASSGPPRPDWPDTAPYRPLDRKAALVPERKRGRFEDVVGGAVEAICWRLFSHFKCLTVSLLGCNPVLGRRGRGLSEWVGWYRLCMRRFNGEYRLIWAQNPVIATHRTPHERSARAGLAAHCSNLA